MTIQIIIYHLLQVLNFCLGICCNLNIEFSLLCILYLADYGIMVGKTEIHKCCDRKVRIYLKLNSW